MPAPSGARGGVGRAGSRVLGHPVALFLQAYSFTLCPSFALRMTKSPKSQPCTFLRFSE